jgi:hypothetical protein
MKKLAPLFVIVTLVYIFCSLLVWVLIWMPLQEPEPTLYGLPLLKPVRVCPAYSHLHPHHHSNLC